MDQLTFASKEVWSAFVQPGEVMEVRIIKAYGKSLAWRGYAHGVVSGYFDDHAVLREAVKAANQTTHAGIYFTLQVIDPRLIGRAFNRLKPADATTSDRDVLAYRWLPVDIDPVRPAGVSASDAELEEALVMRDQVAKWVVSELKFSEPTRANSGNGGHLLFRLPDLPVNTDSQQFIKQTLNGIAGQFNTSTITIDTSVHNPARIWKLYGTTARKGDAVPEGPHREARPHRVAFIEVLANG
jgi:hypothetical protein